MPPDAPPKTLPQLRMPASRCTAGRRKCRRTSRLDCRRADVTGRVLDASALRTWILDEGGAKVDQFGDALNQARKGTLHVPAIFDAGLSTRCANRSAVHA